MKEWNIHVDSVSIKQQQKEVYIDIKGQFMKEWNILVGNVSIKQHEKEI